jgi:hypothetical protein
MKREGDEKEGESEGMSEKKVGKWLVEDVEEEVELR